MSETVVTGAGVTWTVPEVDWVALRAPFPPEQVGKLPKGTERGDKATCSVCGGWHSPGMTHVDYLGHAFVTQRLNEHGGAWVFEVGEFQYAGNDLVWARARLTVGGVTREEVGCADPRKQEYPKLLFSDALSRCAMRHGIGLSLWQKEMPAQDRPTVRATRGATRASGGPRASQARLTNADLETLLAALREDVDHLDAVGAAGWEAWKQGHALWWTTVESVNAGRAFVAQLLSEAGGEPWDPHSHDRDEDPPEPGEY